MAEGRLYLHDVEVGDELYHLLLDAKVRVIDVTDNLIKYALGKGSSETCCKNGFLKTDHKVPIVYKDVVSQRTLPDWPAEVRVKKCPFKKGDRVWVKDFGHGNWSGKFFESYDGNRYTCKSQCSAEMDMWDECLPITEIPF
jgi:hypothetical protein